MGVYRTHMCGFWFHFFKNMNWVVQNKKALGENKGWKGSTVPRASSGSSKKLFSLNQIFSIYKKWEGESLCSSAIVFAILLVLFLW